MTTEEKLQKAISFIKKIETLSLPMIDVGDIVYIDNSECEDCGSADVHCHISNEDIQVILPHELDNLKDEAWHILVDIEN